MQALALDVQEVAPEEMNNMPQERKLPDMQSPPLLMGEKSQPEIALLEKNEEQPSIDELSEGYDASDET